MKNTHIPRSVYEYTATSRRHVGRPKKRWKDQHPSRRNKCGMVMCLLCCWWRRNAGCEHKMCGSLTGGSSEMLLARFYVWLWRAAGLWTCPECTNSKSRHCSEQPVTWQQPLAKGTQLPSLNIWWDDGTKYCEICMAVILFWVWQYERQFIIQGVPFYRVPEYGRCHGMSQRMLGF